MSKTTNDDLTRSNTGCFINVAVPIWQQWASRGWFSLTKIVPVRPPSYLKPGGVVQGVGSLGPHCTNVGGDGRSCLIGTNLLVDERSSPVDTIALVHHRPLLAPGKYDRRPLSRHRLRGGWCSQFLGLLLACDDVRVQCFVDGWEEQNEFQSFG